MAKERAAALQGISTGMLFASLYVWCVGEINSEEKIVDVIPFMIGLLILFGGPFIYNRSKYYTSKYYKEVIERYDGEISYGLGRILALVFFLISFILFFYSMVNYQGVTS